MANQVKNDLKRIWFVSFLECQKICFLILSFLKKAIFQQAKGEEKMIFQSEMILWAHQKVAVLTASKTLAQF